MEIRNLWEIKWGNEFVFLNNIDDVINAIKADKIKGSFIVADYYDCINQEDISFLEQLCKKNNISLRYTDDVHQVCYHDSESFTLSPAIISTEFFNKYKDKIIAAFIECFKNNNFLTINKSLFCDEIFNAILEREEIYVNFYDVKLTEEQIKKLQEKYIDAYIDDKQVSTSKAISSYKRSQLKDKTNISLNNDDILNNDINNFLYLPDNCEISFLLDFNLSPDERYKLISDFLVKLNRLNKPFKVDIDIKNRYSIEKSGLLKENLNNLKITLNDIGASYTLAEYIEEDKKLETLVKDIKEANLSPYEKYIAVYNIVKKYKPYKASDDPMHARSLKYILDNEYMVCVGYANLLEALLGKIGIKSCRLSVDVDTSYDKGFTVENIPVEHNGHARLFVNIDDDKYNIHGIYMADPTWDNDLENDLLNYSLMTLDKLQTNKRMVWNNDTNLIFDVHNFKEFNEHVNYIFKNNYNKEIEKNKKCSYKIENNIIILETYKEIIDTLRKTFHELDLEYWNKIYNKYKFETEADYTNFLTEIGHYIVGKVNKPINSNKTLKANLVGKKVLLGLKKKELNDMKNKVSKKYYERQKKAFPYYLTDENHLGVKEESEGMSK